MDLSCLSKKNVMVMRRFKHQPRGFFSCFSVLEKVHANLHI